MMIRDAEISDSRDILEWTNNPVSSSMFITDKKVAIGEHDK